MAGGTAPGGIALCVGIATRNRCRLVLRALESVADQLRPGDELVVVDNGSDDGTWAAVETWLAEHCPEGRLVLEETAGCSSARNRILREARAPFVCFLDDDARAGRGWLDSLHRAWTDASDRVAVVGGPIPPDWGGPRPAWLRDYFLFVLSILDLGPDRRVLDQSPGKGFVWGGNMSVRVEASLAAGGFDPELGARPNAQFGRGEEQDLQRRLVAQGYQVWYDPDVVVHHYVPAERLSESHFRDQLRAHALVDAADGRGRGAAVHGLARSSARYALARARRDREDAAVARLGLAYAWALLRAI